MRPYAIALLTVILLISVPLVSRDAAFQLVELENVSRFTEDRIAYQQIELSDKQFARMPNMDSSVASLLIIKDKKMYLIKDGFDNLSEINIQKTLLEIEDKIVGDLSLNKISGKPNYVRVTERRVEVLKKIDMNGVDDFVARTFGKFYINLRNAFLEKHVAIFRQLLISKKESGLFVERVRLPRKLILGGGDEKFKFATYVIAKSDDEKIYFAEDADADGVTETFSVNLGDGFHWGFKSGPNIIFIYNNRQEDIKKIIGNLTNEAAQGTKEEEEIIKADMDFQFRQSMRGKSVQGKAWDDQENINRWIQDLIYESELDRKKQ